MRSRNRISALVALALAASVPPLVLTNPAQAAVPPAEVTVVHGIPGTPVNIYVDGKLTVSDFSFGNVAGPLSLSPGTYAIAVRPYKAPATSAPVLSASVAVTSGENASVVAHLTAGGAPALSVFNNPTSAPPTGDARVVVRHVAEAPGVDIYAGSTRVVTDLTNPEQGSLFVPAGDAVVTADLTGTKTTVIGPAAFDFGAGTTTIIYAIGSASAKTLTVATQTYSSPAPVQPAPAQPPAEVTVVHGIPGTSVDIYVDGQLTLSNFTFDQVAGPLALEPGTYTVALLPHGAPATSAPLLETIFPLTSGEDATIVAYLTASGAPDVAVFPNPTATVPVGQAQLIVRHLAEAPGVDIYAGSTKVVTDLPNAGQAALVVPAGNLTVSVNVTGTLTTVIGPASFDLGSGTTTIVYAIGDAADNTLTVATQSY